MNRFIKIVISAVLVSTIVAGASAYAASASMSLSPGTASRAVGSTFSVSIYENSGAEPVNVAEATLAFNASQLRLTGISCSGSFEIAAPAGANGLSCATVNAKTGSQLVGTATFKTLVGSGSGAVSFSGAHVYSATTNSDIAGGTSGANYTFITPVVVPAVVTPTPAPVVVAPVEQLYKATINVVDKNGDIVSGASVTLNGKTVVSDGLGNAVFTDVKAGKYDVKVTNRNFYDITARVRVVRADEKFMIVIKAQPVKKKSSRWLIFGQIATITGIGAILYTNRKKISSGAALVSKKARKTAPATASISALAVTKKTVAKKKPAAKKPAVKKSGTKKSTTVKKSKTTKK